MKHFLSVGCCWYSYNSAVETTQHTLSHTPKDSSATKSLCASAAFAELCRELLLYCRRVQQQKTSSMHAFSAGWQDSRAVILPDTFLRFLKNTALHSPFLLSLILLFAAGVVVRSPSYQNSVGAWLTLKQSLPLSQSRLFAHSRKTKRKGLTLSGKPIKHKPTSFLSKTSAVTSSSLSFTLSMSLSFCEAV